MKQLKLEEIKLAGRVQENDLLLSINGIDVICCDGNGGTFFSLFLEKESARELKRLGFRVKTGEKIDYSHKRKRTIKAPMLDMEGHREV